MLCKSLVVVAVSIAVVHLARSVLTHPVHVQHSSLASQAHQRHIPSRQPSGLYASTPTLRASIGVGALRRTA